MIHQNYFTTIISTIHHGTIAKMTCNHIFDYNMILGDRCNYDLRLLLVWMKMKMKSMFISFKNGDIQ